MSRRPWLPYLILFCGVLIASSASIMIRFAQRPPLEVPSLVIAAGRMSLAALILTPFALGRASAELRTLSRRTVLLAIASGLFLTVHFASWISSLNYTSVASSAALVATNPLWVGLAGLLFLREPIRRAALVGILLTIAGSLLIGFSDSGGEQGSNPLLGDVLALLGAATVSGYFLIGRALRRTVSLLPYIWLVYSTAAVLLLATALLAGHSLWGYPPLAYALLVGLAVGPQLLSHTSFNWALKYLSTTLIAVAILGEPIGSALMAWWLLGESFRPLQLVGVVVLLGGIVVATLAESRTAERTPQAMDDRTLNAER